MSHQAPLVERLRARVEEIRKRRAQEEAEAVPPAERIRRRVEEVRSRIRARREEWRTPAVSEESEVEGKAEGESYVAPASVVEEPKVLTC